jgi:hypothetical protein
MTFDSAIPRFGSRNVYAHSRYWLAAFDMRDSPRYRNVRDVGDNLLRLLSH